MTFFKHPQHPKNLFRTTLCESGTKNILFKMKKLQKKTIENEIQVNHFIEKENLLKPH